ncbi:MAG: GAF domain-containing protein, partial [Candidatus Hydrogenedentales bacterium]
MKESLEIVSSATAAEYVALASAAGGRWSIESESGLHRSLPTSLLAEVLDRDIAVAEGDWIAAPLVPRRAAAGVLIVHAAKANRETANVLDALAAALATGLASVRARQQQVRRTEELETILELAAQWNQTHEMVPLLEQMAQTATRLIRADRASIFLWDRPNRTLVGRPALGVEGGELRIPDDTGIVGQVVQHGMPRRVSSADLAQQKQINRSVDTKLGYQTSSLLCVPLRTPAGEMIGAFELINKLDGDFTDDDEAMLIELAGHAATAL